LDNRPCQLCSTMIWCCCMSLGTYSVHPKTMTALTTGRYSTTALGDSPMEHATKGDRSGLDSKASPQLLRASRMWKGYRRQGAAASMINLCKVLLSVFLLCPFRLAAQPQSRPTVPVLTLCEALRDLNLYRGKQVAIVARSVWTFEGTFLSGKCEADG